jgi:hypothetical protein
MEVRGFFRAKHSVKGVALSTAPIFIGGNGERVSQGFLTKPNNLTSSTDKAEEVFYCKKNINKLNAVGKKECYFFTSLYM